MSAYLMLGALSSRLSFISDYTYLSSCVNNLCRKLLAILEPNELAECVLDGWVIALDKVAVYKADRERRFTCDV